MFSIHPIIGCDMWIGEILEFLDLGICSEYAIVSMVFLDDDSM